MKIDETISVLREDLERLASAFNAMTVIIDRCDSTDACNVATIFERHIYALLDEADAAAHRHEGGAA